jgi:hypothetical protein
MAKMTRHRLADLLVSALQNGEGARPPTEEEFDPQHHHCMHRTVPQPATSTSLTTLTCFAHFALPACTVETRRVFAIPLLVIRD